MSTLIADAVACLKALPHPDREHVARLLIALADERANDGRDR